MYAKSASEEMKNIDHINVRILESSQKIEREIAAINWARNLLKQVY